MLIEKTIEKLYENLLFDGSRLLIGYMVLTTLVLINDLLIVMSYIKNSFLMKVLLLENFFMVIVILTIWATTVMVTDDIGKDFYFLAEELANIYQWLGIFAILSYFFCIVITVIRVLHPKRGNNNVNA